MHLIRYEDMWEKEAKVYTLLFFVLDEDESSESGSSCFTTKNESLGTYCSEGWLDLRDGLEVMAK
jgi:hypothetical protein